MGHSETRLEGACHCGAVRVALRTDAAPAALALRRCDCSLCRRHGARAFSEPSAALEIRMRPRALTRYRFGLGTADFLLCATCGVYVGALMEEDGTALATLNANVLDARDTLDPAPPLVSYAGETPGNRRKRRRARWMPAELREESG